MLMVETIVFVLFQTVAMKFILKHRKSEKDIYNLRQEIAFVFFGVSFLLEVKLVDDLPCHAMLERFRASLIASKVVH